MAAIGAGGSHLSGERHAAHEYVSHHGWRVLPVHSITNGACTCGDPRCDRAGKHPWTEHGYKDASGDHAVIEAWWERWPSSNVGIATGAMSGFDVIDVDPRHGGDETLAELERRHGPLPMTVMSHTGGGGDHLFFAHADGVRSAPDKKLGRGLDVRADGGFIVAPPSLHVSGRRYAWDVDHHIDDVPIVPAPAWLLELLQPPEGTLRMARPPEFWCELIAGGIDDGRRNASITSLIGLLLRRYVDPAVVLELARCVNDARCRPPLEDNEILRIMKSIGERELARRRRDG
jgi:hypothetical protein